MLIPSSNVLQKSLNLNKIKSRLGEKESLEKKICLVNGIIGLAIVPVFSCLHFYNLALFFLMTNLVLNLIFCCMKLNKRIVLLFFYLAIFMFLITRILVPAMKGWEWWTNYSLDANTFAIIAISISLIFLMIGTLGIELCIEKEKIKIVDKQWFDKQCFMQVLRIILTICMVCFFVVEIEKLIFMQGKAYEEYYISYESNMPFLIYFPAGCMNYFLCAFLALMPSKKESFIWLSLFILSAVPMLLIGARNPIVLNCIFAFLYYFLRDVIRKKKEKKWIGKYEKRLLICLLPIAVIFLGMYNYTREDVEVKMSPSEIVVDFCFKQGTTYDTVLQGYIYRDQLPNKDEKIYTLGALQEEILYNTLGRIIFKSEDIGNGNSEKRAKEGSSFSHAISYVVMEEQYLNGHGRGSSYIIENYVDLGYLGIILFSLFLSGICSLIVYLFGKKWLATVIGLMMLMNIFFTPRAESTAFLCFLVSYKFWICMIGCVVVERIWEMIRTKKGYKANFFGNVKKK